MSDTKPNRYFITGSAGFIGSHLVDRLINSGEVTEIPVEYNPRLGKQKLGNIGHGWQIASFL